MWAVLDVRRTKTSESVCSLRGQAQSSLLMVVAAISLSRIPHEAWMRICYAYFFSPPCRLRRMEVNVR